MGLRNGQNLGEQDRVGNGVVQDWALFREASRTGMVKRGKGTRMPTHEQFIPSQRGAIERLSSRQLQNAKHASKENSGRPFVGISRNTQRNPPKHSLGRLDISSLWQTLLSTLHRKVCTRLSMKGRLGFFIKLDCTKACPSPKVYC